VPKGGFDSWAIYNGYTALACMKGLLDKNKVYHHGVFVPNRPGIEVANMSYGDKLLLIKPPMLPMFTFISHYILCVCSTGNDNSATLNLFPARHPQAFSVTGYRSTGGRWVNSTTVEGSNYAPDIDIAAPTESTYTCDLVGKNTSNVDLGYTEFAWNDEFYGTSAAAPHIAAIALLVSAKFDLLDPGSVKGETINTQIGTEPGGVLLWGFDGRITRHPSAVKALGLQ
jgi:Subtilase family